MRAFKFLAIWILLAIPIVVFGVYDQVYLKIGIYWHLLAGWVVVLSVIGIIQVWRS